MAKDDYEVITYKILVYLYACMKRVAVFDQTVFDRTVRKDVANEDYFHDILRLMQDERLIDGVILEEVWGGMLLASDLADMRITAEGIRYLHDNSRTERAKNAIKETADIIGKLMGLLKLV